MCGCDVGRRIFRNLVCGRPDFLLNGSGYRSRVFGRCDRPPDYDVGCSGMNRFGGSHDPGLVPVIGPGRSHAGIDDQEILPLFCAQGFYFSR